MPFINKIKNKHEPRASSTLLAVPHFPSALAPSQPAGAPPSAPDPSKRILSRALDQLLRTVKDSEFATPEGNL
jgi:hypothetical protein